MTMPPIRRMASTTTENYCDTRILKKLIITVTMTTIIGTNVIPM